MKSKVILLASLWFFSFCRANPDQLKTVKSFYLSTFEILALTKKQLPKEIDLFQLVAKGSSLTHINKDLLLRGFKHSPELAFLILGFNYLWNLEEQGQESRPFQLQSFFPKTLLKELIADLQPYTGEYPACLALIFAATHILFRLYPLQFTKQDSTPPPPPEKGRLSQLIQDQGL